MAQYLLKYADSRGQIHQKTAEAGTEQELRDKYTQQGFLIYSIRPKGGAAQLTRKLGGRKQKLNAERFLIFNQQFVTLIRAGLPILKSLDLLAERLTDQKLGRHIKAVRDDVKTGTSLSDAYANQGVFPPVYVTTVMAGEKSGALAEVLERYIAYQRLAMSARKKMLLSLLYPALLILVALALIVYLVAYVVPSFAELYTSMSADLPALTQILISFGTAARKHILIGAVGVVAGAMLFRLWARTARGQERLDRMTLRTPVAGEIWIKYQVAQVSRVLSTLLIGGIPLLQALETAAQSMGSSLLRKSLDQARKMVKEGQALSASLKSTGVFPGLAIDMVEVGESTGALPAMLSSVADFYEEDVTTRMQAALSLVEPVLMLLMGAFVAVVLLALYLPIFTLAEKLS